MEKTLGNYDCVVVGAGPVGTVAARYTARQGARVLLVEKGDTSTYPDRCTGIISPRCLDEADVGNSVVLREIRGGTIHAPNGSSLRLETQDTRALVIDRHLFNSILLKMVQETGVDLTTRSRVVGLDGQRVIIQKDGLFYEAKTKVVIGADGPKSQVANWAKLPPPGQVLLGLQATARHELEEPDSVEIFFDQDLAPGFFAWVVPAEEGIARVGLATTQMKDASSLLKRFLNKLHLESLKINAGLIPIGPRQLTVSDGVLVVGDAAAQAKPTSGGGLYTGIIAAKIAGEVAAHHALDPQDGNGLMMYEKRWREKLGHELSLGMTLRRLFGQLHNPELNFIFDVLDNKALLDIIKSYGDIDYPSLIIKALLQQPKEWWKLLRGLNVKFNPTSQY